MSDDHDRKQAAQAALVGCAGLAAAMGIGRFAFTPLMPLMQDAHALSLAGGAWLATANYLGYLIGAVACFVAPPRPAAAARWGLAAVAGTTLPMALTDGFAAWLMLRLACGIASAYVLVGVSAWALPRLARAQRPAWAGWVFAGVGAGIMLAGLAGLLADLWAIGPGGAWIVLGTLAAAVAAGAWRTLQDRGPRAVVPTTAGRNEPGAMAPTPAAPHPGPLPLASGRGGNGFQAQRGGRAAWLLVACYGAFGLGYIVPATFIPAMARALVPDPAVFGWAWPAFGAAAAVSTTLASTLFGHAAPRQVAAGGLLLMAVGVAAPALHAGLFAVLAAAVLVGGTFMVVTMASMQLAREHAPADATRLMAAMTAAFAIGQLLGPLMVGLWSDPARAIGMLSGAAAILLLLSSAVLAVGLRRGPAATPTPRMERTLDA